LAGLEAAFPKPSGTVVDARRLEIAASPHRPPAPKFVSFSLMKLDAHRLMAVFLDITLQVREERALRESEEVRLHAEARFRAVIEKSPVPYALVDEAGRLTFINRAFVDAFGYTLEDVPTREIWWLKAYPNGAYRRWVHDTWHGRVGEAASTGKPFEPMEVFIRCKDGSQRTAISNVADLDGAYRGTHLANMIRALGGRFAVESPPGGLALGDPLDPA
jgi:PAS domain S-box-containing protein